ncbi:hypothetical protein BaRGS_00022825, partial [Batillaria attramentaria]
TLCTKHVHCDMHVRTVPGTVDVPWVLSGWPRARPLWWLNAIGAVRQVLTRGLVFGKTAAVVSRALEPR